MAKVSGLVLRSLRMTSDLASINQKGFERNFMPLVPFRFYSQSQSSTSNWGAGEPPVEDIKERGVTLEEPGSTGPSAVEKPVGRQSSPTSTSSFDTGAEVQEQPGKSSTGQHSSSGTAEKPSGQQGSESPSSSEPKKSRTGGDMTDEGQVQTPNLQKMRSTREIIQDKGKETEDRLASEKKSA